MEMIEEAIAETEKGIEVLI